MPKKKVTIQDAYTPTMEYEFDEQVTDVDHTGITKITMPSVSVAYLLVVEGRIFLPGTDYDVTNGKIQLRRPLDHRVHLALISLVDGSVLWSLRPLTSTKEKKDT